MSVEVIFMMFVDNSFMMLVGVYYYLKLVFG